MKRIKDLHGVVHYVHPCHAGHTLCARTGGTDLLGKPVKLGDTTAEPVTCTDCARTVCAIRNEPYNTLMADIDDATAMRGIYDAVKPDGCGCGLCERQQLGAEPCACCTDPVMVGEADEQCLCDHCAVRQRDECEQWLNDDPEVICASVCSEFEEAQP